ncbi:Uncharacterised protein [Mycobacteroides abscessus subsp. abscessus]|nr:Uncharacterised protein [Mycobacteroides abscessus subsp. abscessus]SKY19865.1 Uncharacterised protein [Mycobacteroides abscessus subsp. abscessus]
MVAWAIHLALTNPLRSAHAAKRMLSWALSNVGMGVFAATCVVGWSRVHPAMETVSTSAATPADRLRRMTTILPIRAARSSRTLWRVSPRAGIGSAG